jgi:outer membrane immunogenic protein
MRMHASLIVSLTALLAGTASAADFPLRKADSLLPPPPPPPIWTGFYVGLNAGATWSNYNSVNITEQPSYISDGPLSEITRTTTPLRAVLSSTSIPLNTGPNFMGGGQTGYNHSINDVNIIGLEIDFQGFTSSKNYGQSQYKMFPISYYSPTLQRSNIETNSNIYLANKNLNYLGTVRGRIGYLIAPNLLGYGTAGLAYGGVSSSAYAQQQASTGATDEFGPGGNSTSSLRLGWAAGGGFEWYLAQNLSIKVEYLYYNLGMRSSFMGQSIYMWNGVRSYPGLSAGQIVSITDTQASTQFSGNIVRAGVNYHLNFAAAPVIAKF